MVEVTRHMGLLYYSWWKWPGTEVTDVIDGDSDQVSVEWRYLWWQWPGKQMSDDFHGNSSKTECSLVSAPHYLPNRTASLLAHPWKKWVIFLDWKLSKLKRESGVWAAQQTHSKSGHWRLEVSAHILRRLCWKLWGKVMVLSDGVWRWMWLCFVVTAIWDRHLERSSGYIRGIAAETRAEGGWNLLTGRPALEEPNVTAMHPDGGIIYQTPPGRKNTVCRWLENGRLALQTLSWVAVKDRVRTAQ